MSCPGTIAPLVGCCRTCGATPLVRLEEDGYEDWHETACAKIYPRAIFREYYGIMLLHEKAAFYIHDVVRFRYVVVNSNIDLLAGAISLETLDFDAIVIQELRSKACLLELRGEII